MGAVIGIGMDWWISFYGSRREVLRWNFYRIHAKAVLCSFVAHSRIHECGHIHLMFASSISLSTCSYMFVLSGYISMYRFVCSFSIFNPVRCA